MTYSCEVMTQSSFKWRPSWIGRYGDSIGCPARRSQKLDSAYSEVPVCQISRFWKNLRNSMPVAP